MSATLIAGTAALAAPAIAALTIALVSWRWPRHAAATLADALAVALEGALSAETQHAELREAPGALRGRLDRMILPQSRMAQAVETSGYQAAIDLTREDADDDVLTNTCGLARGEARLLPNLYQGHAH